MTTGTRVCGMRESAKRWGRRSGIAQVVTAYPRAVMLLALLVLFVAAQGVGAAVDPPADGVGLDSGVETNDNNFVSTGP